MKREIQRGIAFRGGLQHPHARARDLGPYTIPPDNRDLDHPAMLATKAGAGKRGPDIIRSREERS